MPKPKLNGTISAEKVRELLTYSLETGIFRWRVDRRGTAKAGTVAGLQKRRHGRGGGHIEIKVMGQRYMAHRLAWLWVTGEWPTEEIDHEDMNPSNNAWSNLRLATGSQNQSNRRALRTNECGLKGVSPCFGAIDRATGVRKRRAGKYKAQIKVGGRVVYLGQFNSPELAHEAYKKAAEQYHGKFARA